MRKNLRWGAILLSVLGMGMAMPSCPGQQAMQEQIDRMQATQTEQLKRVQNLTTQTSKMNQDMTQIKQLLTDMTNVISSQKGLIDKLSMDLQSLQKGKGKKKK